MVFESRDKEGNPRTLEETFWECIDEAQKEWDLQANLPEDSLSELGEVGKMAYLSQRLIGPLSNILTLARMMKEKK